MCLDLMTKYGTSPWIDRFPKSRVPDYPRQRGPLETDVAIIGAGLTGCATAYAMAAADVRVVLIESERIGRGGAGSGAGWIADDPGVSFADLQKALGLRPARRAWQAWHRAGLDFAALLRRLKISLEPHGSVDVATTAEQTLRLAREQKARREAGLDAPMLKPRAVGAEAGLAAPGIRARDGATIDPYRAALALARAAVQRGAQVFERSPAVRIEFGSRTADIKTEHGTIRANRVVVATGGPTPLFKALRRHFWFRRRYAVLTAPVPADIRRRLGRREAVVRDLGDPAHIVRWVGGERLLVTGADAERQPDRQRDKTLIQRTGQLMYELSTMYPDISGIAPEYGWDAAYARTGDGLPYIGPHRNYPHHLFAFGDSSHSATGGYLASRILLRHHLGEPDAADEVFGFR
ncbi:MAG: FAD-binding oxidoreductase [Acidobacteriota bacterium]